MTHDSHYSTCLGHLGQYHGQGKYMQLDIAGISVPDIALNITNVNSAKERHFHGIKNHRQFRTQTWPLKIWLNLLVVELPKEPG